MMNWVRMQLVNLSALQTRDAGRRQLCRIQCCRLTAIRCCLCCALERGKSQLSQLHLVLHLSPDRAILLITRLGLVLMGASPLVLVLPAVLTFAPFMVPLLLAAPLVPIWRQRAATCSNAHTIGTSVIARKPRTRWVYYQTLQQVSPTHPAHLLSGPCTRSSIIKLLDSH